MAKAERVHSTPRPRTSLSDPVVELGRQLRRVLDADDEADRQQSAQDGSSSLIWAEDRAQFGDWIETVERTISFTQASTLEGALAQLALSFDVLDDLVSRIENGDNQGIRRRRMQIDRLLRSVVRVLMDNVKHADPDLRSLVASYTGTYEHSENWLDKAGLMADAGRVQRLSHSASTD